jgi:hypothetical protein
MINKDQPAEQQSTPKNHWVLWTLVSLFIVVSIGVMFAVDYNYAGAPEVSKPVPGAAEN